MGKVRIKTLGAEGLEEEQKKRDEKRRAKKRAKKEAAKGVKTPGMKGGERVVAVGPSESEIKEAEESKQKEPKATSSKKYSKSTTTTPRPPKVRSARYQKIKAHIDRAEKYSLSQAIELVKKAANTAFAESIEAHFNLTKKPKELNLKNKKGSKIYFERKSPLAHTVIGKTDAKDTDLTARFSSIIKIIGPRNIKKATLSSTMGPGVKVKVQ